MATIRIAGVQMDLLVGDIDANEAAIADAMAWAESKDVDVLVFPELTVTGYPPEDLVLRDAFVDANVAAIRRLAERSANVTSVVGFVDRASGEHRAADDAFEREVANAAAILHDGEVRGVYHKVLLPNYGVFDEDRHFSVGGDPAQVWDIGDVRVGVSICEDIWVLDGPPTRQAAAGAQLLVNINGSPFHYAKGSERVELIRRQAVMSDIPVIYVNRVGGQDELVFDGGSMVFDAGGRILYRGPAFEEARFVIDVDVPVRPAVSQPTVVRSMPIAVPDRVEEPESTEPLEPLAEVYRALLTGLRDYVRKNGFSKVVVGLSGGIDSALTAAIAADALGPENVRGVTMPSRFSSEGSVLDSKDLAARLGIRFDEIYMDDIFAAYLNALGPVFEGTEFGVAEENIQARIRGALIMAISNKHGEMVVATGNKSEMAVGYATLYGDMAGGYAVLKDVFKTLVYQLSVWRNRDEEVIPTSIINKPPSAELRPDQKDSDSLPDYDLLDGILSRYIEEDASIDQIIRDGFDGEVVRRVARLVDLNEYKRRQAAPGVKITTKAFGRDRRLPITNGWRNG
jgi:NAD+ synthase (glutamine-hydrolysing)